MSDTTGPVADPTPTSATEPLQLADRQPIESAVIAQRPHQNHTRTILEVVGAGVAAMLILAAGGLGFALGHVTGNDGRDGGDRGRAFSQGAPNFGEPGGMMRRHSERGFGPQGFGPQGPGQQGFGPEGPQGMDPRGMDPDGDNWTGGDQGLAPATPSVPSSPSVQ